MDRLKTAKGAIKRATDSLVKAAQDSIRQEEEAPVAIKADIFKEVIDWTKRSKVHFSFRELMLRLEC